MPRAIASGEIDYRVFEPADEIAVRVYGEAAAIRYRSNLRIVVGGQDLGLGHSWHTDLYERRDGRRQAVWSQATANRDWPSHERPSLLKTPSPAAPGTPRGAGTTPKGLTHGVFQLAAFHACPHHIAGLAPLWCRPRGGWLPGETRPGILAPTDLG